MNSQPFHFSYSGTFSLAKSKLTRQNLSVACRQLLASQVLFTLLLLCLILTSIYSHCKQYPLLFDKFTFKIAQIQHYGRSLHLAIEKFSGRKQSRGIALKGVVRLGARVVHTGYLCTRHFSSHHFPQELAETSSRELAKQTATFPTSTLTIFLHDQNENIHGPCFFSVHKFPLVISFAAVR